LVVTADSLCLVKLSNERSPLVEAIPSPQAMPVSLMNKNEASTNFLLPHLLVDHLLEVVASPGTMGMG
jgi:hypothetical protein